MVGELQSYSQRVWNLFVTFVVKAYYTLLSYQGCGELSGSKRFPNCIKFLKKFQVIFITNTPMFLAMYSK